MITALLLVGSLASDLGIACDCVSDDWAAIQQWADSGDLELDLRGEHCCRVSRTIEIDRPNVRIIGDAPYRFSHGKYAGTYLKFPPATDGVRLAPGAQGARIEGLSIIGTKTRSSAATGLRMQAVSEIRDVTIADFDGNGITAFCGDMDERGRVTNCNNSRLNYVEAQTNGGWGIEIAGGDSNAWTVDYFTGNQNDLGCILTRSFLGSHFVTVHCQDQDGASTGGVRAENVNARNVFSWLYMEGSGIVHLVPPSIRLGGIGGNDTERSSFIEGNVFRGQWSFRNTLEPARQKQLSLGNACGDPGCALAFETSNEGRSGPLKLGHERGWYTWHVGPIRTHAIGDIEAGENWGRVSFAYPIVMGTPPNDRSLFWSDGMPRGSCRGGDFRINSAIGPSDRCSIFVCDAGAWACGSRVQ